MLADGHYALYGYEAGERLTLVRMYFSYGYNSWGTEGAFGPNAKGLGDVAIPGINFSELRASRVLVPSDMIAIADSTADGLFDHFIKPNPDVPSTTPGRVHMSGANVLYCDGHVQWSLQDDLLIYNDQGHHTPQHAWRWRMWNYDHRTNWNGDWQ